MKIWFQNKRSKQKKVVKNVSHHSSSSTQPSSHPNLSPDHRTINNKSFDSMFLVKQEQPTSSTITNNSNSFLPSSPYARTMDYTNHFWSLPPPSYAMN